MKALKKSFITALLLLLSISVKGGIVGSTLQNPIQLGTKTGNFTYNSGRLVISRYGDCYGVFGADDVFMEITLSVPMEIEIIHQDLGAHESYLHILNSERVEIESGDYSNGSMAYIDTELPAGKYYIVSEARWHTLGYLGITINGAPIVYSQEYGYSVPPTITSIQSGAVGAIGGSFNVSAMGAATYTIPIDIPLGVGGFQPQLSLIYNSQAGNGLCGYGTNVNGFSSITRGPKDIYHDGTAQGIKYLADDALYLDGVRLILSEGTAGQNGAKYKLESDPFTTVITRVSSNNIYYEVDRHDGLTYYYGSTSDSRLSYTKGSSSRIHSWYLCRVEKPAGDYMAYSYQKENYCIYPDKISYGGPGYPNNTQLNVVEFTYETRSDTIPIRFDGKNGRMNRRLKTITGKTNGNVYRSYNLEYNTTGDGTDYKFSRLVSVTKKNGQNESLPAAQFNWSYLPGPSNFANSVSVENPNVNSHFVSFSFPDHHLLSGDMNNDGITDIIGLQNVEVTSGGSKVQRTYVNVYESQRSSSGDVSFNKGRLYDLDPSFVYGKYYSGLGSISTLDCDGDGKNELIIPYFTKINNDRSVTFVLLRYDGSGDMKSYTLPARHESMPQFATGDLDKDGKDEIIYAEYASDGIILNVIKYNAGSFIRQQIDCPYTDYPNHLYVTDMNGNGMNDIVTIPSNGYKIFWNQGGQTIGSSFSGQNYSSQSQPDSDIKKMFYLGDFNGDGLPDFLASSNENWFFYLNNGNGGLNKQWACTLNGIFDQTFTPNDDDKFHCEVLDFDHDGKTDIIVTKADYEWKRKKILGIYYGEPWGEFLKTHTFWLRSTGTSLVEVHHATSNRENDAYDRKFITGDFDGDGRVELMNYGYDCSHGDNADSDPLWRIYKNSGLYDRSGKVTSITGDFGAVTSITYSTLTDPSVYNKGNETSYPAPKYTLPINVVKSVTQSNGAAGSNSSNYSYSGLRIHLKGKGVLGFTSSQVNNSTLGTTVKTEIKGWNNTYYVPSSTKVTTTISGMGSAYTQNTLSFVDKGNTKYFAYPSQTVETDFNGKSVTTSRTYNTTHGYITNETITYEPNMYKSVSYSDYVLAGYVYKPCTVVTSQQHPDDTALFSDTTRYTYNTFAGWVTSVTANDGIQTQYTYNSWGNLANEVIVVAGAPYLTTYYTYDDTERFPVRIYTNPSSSEKLYTYDLWGNVLTERDYINSSINNTITHTYDNWGNLIRTQKPGYGEVSYVRGWGNTASKRFFVLEQGTSRPWVKTWYDNQGREVLTESIGPKNVAISNSITYNNKGLKASESETTGNLSLSHTYEYDNRGRIKRIEHNPSNKVITYDYNDDDLTTTITENDESTIYWYDVIGNLKRVQGPMSNDVTYEYSSNGNTKKIVANGATWEMKYDRFGHQTKLIDPDAGTTQFTYDALGREIRRIDGRGVVYATNYDNLGRVISRSADYDVIQYNYGTNGTGQLRLESESNSAWTKHYEYDTYGRLTEEVLNQADFTRSKSYQYTAAGLLSSCIYPDDRKVSYTYDSYGNCATISAGTSSYNYLTWTLTGYNGKTMTSSVNTGGGYPYVRTTQLDNNGLLQSRVLKRQNTTLKSDNYSFDGQTGNLMSRTVNGVAQSFNYDKADRLTGVTTGQNQINMTYSTNGNITSKSDIGQYNYNNTTRPHAVTDVDMGGSIPYQDQWLYFNSWNKVTEVEYSKGNDFYFYSVEYSPDQQRTFSVLSGNNGLVYAKFSWDEYEEYYVDGNNSYIYYWIEAPDGLAGMLMYDSEDFYHPIHPYAAMTDHLGSLTALYDENTNKVHEASYDAWGKRTLGQVSMPFVTRGFTGHEHLDELDLINMNGRFYDPNLGRFLSPDPFVQSPGNPQNFNRYSYCLNNPLKYTDPSGNIVTEALVFAALMSANINVAIQGMLGNIDTPLDAFCFAGIGALSSIAGGLAGGAVMSSLGGASCLVGAIGNGALAGIVGGGLSGAITGGGNALVNGDNFGKALGQGLLWGAASGGLFGGISEGVRYHRAIGLFTKGCEMLGVDEDGPVAATDEMLLEAQKTWYPDAPMDHVNKLSVATGKWLDHLNKAIETTGHPAWGTTVPLHPDGIYTGMSNVYIHPNTFSSAKQLFYAMGHEFVHVNQIALLSGLSYDKYRPVDDFLSLMEFGAYSYQHSLDGVTNLSSWDQARVRAFVELYGKDIVTKMSGWSTYGWTGKATYKYPF